MSFRSGSESARRRADGTDSEEQTAYSDKFRLAERGAVIACYVQVVVGRNGGSVFPVDELAKVSILSADLLGHNDPVPREEGVNIRDQDTAP